MDTAELEWIAWTNPITTAFGAEVAASDLSGRTVACHQHIVPDSICIVGPLLQAGARVRMAPCNPDSTDDRTATHLASMGVEHPSRPQRQGPFCRQRHEHAEREHGEVLQPIHALQATI